MKPPKGPVSKRVADKVIEKYGAARIEAGRQRLCANCSRGKGGCCDEFTYLLPITSDGDDCPYFRPLQLGGR